MGQHAFNQSFNMSVVANYNSLMGGIDLAIQADGWTLEADSGATDPGAAALPAQNADTVYRVYKSPTVAGLTSIYVKLIYGWSAANDPWIKVQCGTTTDGAGTLGGITTTQRQCRANRSNANHAYASGGEGYLMVCFCPAETDTSGAFFLIERSIDGTETLTDGHFTQVTYTVDSSACFQESKMLSGGTQPPVQTSIRSPAPSPVGGGTWIIDTFLSVPLMLPIVRGGLAQHSPNVGVHTSGATDFAPDSVTVINVYGSDHDYLVTGFPIQTGQRAMVRYQ